MDEFEKICKEIKEVKIQGAENVARAAVRTLKYRSDSKAINHLISLRPTEPALKNAINFALSNGINKALDYFDEADRKISNFGSSLIKKNDKVFTHCHASTVIRILKESKSKNITVYNTETRPLFQGRLTSKDLSKLGIKNFHFVDSAMRLALKDCNLVLIGADSITEKKVYNKIGSELVAETAKRFNIPVYVCSAGWKFDANSVYNETKIEERSSKEVWADAPKDVKVLNPAFEKIDPNLIKGVVSEFGVLTFKDFIKKVKKEYNWMF